MCALHFLCEFVCRSYVEMETSRAKSATPTRDHVAASGSDAANADADGEENISFTHGSHCSF